MIVEWRIVWAEGLTAEERSNLRSWGVNVDAALAAEQEKPS